MSKVTAKLTRDRMNAAREDRARQLLAWDVVVKTISEAAGKGLERAVFGPPGGVSIKATKAAAETIQKLAAAEFRVEWRDRRDPDGGLNHELVVGWDGGVIGA